MSGLKMRIALAAASFVILIVHGVVFYQQFFHKWQGYQTAYFDQARAMARSDEERVSFDARSPRIEQTIVTQFGETRVDRCQTCHIGADDPRFKDYAEPLRAHPYSEALGDRMVDGRWERRHKFNDFGCTVCHDGQGRGLQAFYAHGEDHFWPDPMLGYVTQEPWRDEFKAKLVGADYMQANCAQCHTEEAFRSTPLVAQGRKLFVEKNCYGCHKIEGISQGTLGPELTDVGRKFKVDYLWESIVDPRANLKTSFMPKFALTDDEVKALVVFLKSRKGLNLTETSLEHYRASLNQPSPQATTAATTEPAEAGPTLVARGEQLVKERACVACHKLGDVDGRIAPDLSFEGLLKDDVWLMEHFRDPRSRMPDSIMPTFGFADPDYRAMTTYLRALTTKPPAAQPADAFKNYCARCHGENGAGDGMIALYLDPSPRDLTKAAFMNSKSTDRFLNSIRDGVPGTSMPAWKQVFTDDQIRGLFDYIETAFVKQPRRELRALNVPDQNPLPASDDSVARGERIFMQRCTGCHGRKADGKGANSLDILPRPRNLRNAAFINATTDRRLFESILYGVQGTAMPSWIDYGMTNDDVGDLVNYLRRIAGKK